MIITEYEPDKELTTYLAELLEQEEFPDIEHVKLAIAYIVRTKADDESNEPLPPKSNPVALKKVPPAFKVFMKDEPDFVIIVDKYFWNESDAKQKRAYLGRFLTRILAEPKESGDGFKLSVKPWDIQDNLDTIKRFGLYDEKWILVSEVVRKQHLQKQTLEMAGAHDSAPAPKTEKAPARAKAQAKASSPMPEDEEPEPSAPADEEEEVPRVRAATLPQKSKPSPLKKSKNGEEEVSRPARRIPPDPPKTNTDEAESDAEPPEPV